MEPMTEPAIEATGLTKTYDRRTVVDIDHLRIERGEVFALLGPNGAGKTTFVEMCEGHRSASTGRLAVLGTDPMAGRSAWRSRIGIVTQETGAFDRLTVAEAVGHLAAFYPSPRSLQETLAMTDLLDLGDRLVDQLSGGQRRRLDLACGIVGRPELLFLDEPTTGLDPEVRRRLWSMIDGLRDAGTKIVLTTHYLDEAEQLADRVGVLADGALIAVDTPDGLGGHDANQTIVSFRPSPATETLLATHDWHTIDRECVAIRTTRPAALVVELHRLGGEVDQLEITRPSLEDVYLRLIEDHTATAGRRPHEDRPHARPHVV